MARVAITGANGFLGGAICEALQKAGHQTRAIVRRRRHEHGTPKTVEATVEATVGATVETTIETVVAPLVDGPALIAAVSGCEVLIHCAGGGRAITAEDFDRNNFHTTTALLSAIVAAGEKGPRRFVLISSVSAGGPNGNSEATLDFERSQARSLYGQSKWQAEKAARAVAGERAVVILRVPSLYGPGDDRIGPLFAAARVGIVPAPSPDQGLSMVDVDDCAAAIAMLCFSEVESGAVYWIEDGERYSPRRLARAAGAALGKNVRVLGIPIAVLEVAARLQEWRARRSQKAAFLTRDKVRDLGAASWICDSSSLRRDTGWRPRHTFESRASEIAARLRHRG